MIKEVSAGFAKFFIKVLNFTNLSKLSRVKKLIEVFLKKLLFNSGLFESITQFLLMQNEVRCEFHGERASNMELFW